MSYVHSHLFSLTQISGGDQFYFRDDASQIIQSGQQPNNSTLIPLGIATAGDSLTYWFPDGDSTRVLFEPRAAYRISPTRERLYPLERDDVLRRLKSFDRKRWLTVGTPRYVVPDLKKQTIPSALVKSQPIPKLSLNYVSGRIQFTTPPEAVEKILIAPAWSDSFYIISHRVPERLIPGEYAALYFFKNDSVRSQNFTVHPDSLLLIAYDHQRSKLLTYRGTNRKLSAAPVGEKLKVLYEEIRYSGSVLYGTVTDTSGEPLIGASLLIKGTTSGTVTDIDGNFALRGLSNYNTLIVSYTGFATLEVPVYRSYSGVAPLTIVLEESAAHLDEVVVTALGYKYAGDYSDELDIDEILQGKAAGVTAQGLVKERKELGYTVAPGASPSIVIRGLSTVAGAQLLYIVNGNPVDNIDQLTKDQIAKIEVLKDASATAIYGAAAANGVVIITTRNGEAGLATASLPPPDTRSNFADYAAFHPELRTDRQGRAVFDITFPDDITAWNTFAVGQDRKRRVGFTTARTNAFLPLQAQLYLHRFLVAGDESEAATLAINRTEEDREVQLTFSGDDLAARTQGAVLKDSQEQRYPISADGVGDSLSYQFTLQTTSGEPESDGERRSFPVFPVGTEMTTGEHFLLAPGQTELPLDFIRAERGPVTLRIFGNRVERLLDDIDHVVDYPYACTEQTASRLLGLLSLRRIREAEGVTFRREREIRKMIRRLEKLARNDGSYGWWPGSAAATPWISGHVFRALMAAEQAGYPVHDLTPLRKYFLSALPELAVNDQLSLLLTLSEAGFPTTRQELDRLDSISSPTDYQFLARTRLHQLRGDTIAADNVLARSTVYAGRGRYWGDQQWWFARQPLGDRLACGLLAHRILREAGRDSAADEAAAYLLGRTAGSQAGREPLLGTNTLESARLIAGLLPDLLVEDDLRPPSVTVDIGNRPTPVTALPYVQNFAPAPIAIGAPNLRLNHSGSGPLLVSLHQRWFEATPSVTSSGFTLATQLVDERGRHLTRLKQGQTAYLDVTVTSTADADYVLLEIPIPAGCSYAKRSEEQGPYAIHREYRRDRVAVFCDMLPAGTHTYRVALAPRFSGSYTVNPARAEMQYLPRVNGNTGLETIKIGE